jgi:hypothetical protein
MTTSALVMVSVVWTIVTFATGFFFYKVLTTPPKPEPDSFSENDKEEARQPE